MGILDRIAGLFRSEPDPRGLWIYVRCDHCGEVISTRLNLHNDLSPDYRPDGQPTGYHSRKTLVGSAGCFERIEVNLAFDANRRIIDRSVSGGTFVTREEYETAEASQA